MITHTPGPWSAYHWSGTDCYSDVHDVAGGILVDGSETMLSHVDACLISAAPELLEALKRLGKHTTGCGYRGTIFTGECTCGLRAVIAKAEGRI